MLWSCKKISPSKIWRMTCTVSTSCSPSWRSTTRWSSPPAALLEGPDKAKMSITNVKGDPLPVPSEKFLQLTARARWRFPGVSRTPRAGARCAPTGRAPPAGARPLRGGSPGAGPWSGAACGWTWRRTRRWWRGACTCGPPRICPWNTAHTATVKMRENRKEGGDFLATRARRHTACPPCRPSVVVKGRIGQQEDKTREDLRRARQD